MAYNRKPQGSSPLRMGDIMIYAAGVLLLLVVLSTHMMAGLFARYTTHSTSQDQARVAGFSVNIGGVNDDIAVTCLRKTDDTVANGGTYTITVKSESEVAVRYDIVMTLTSPLPAGVAVSLDDGTIAPVMALDADDTGIVSFAEVGEIAPGRFEAKHELHFNVDWAEFTKNASGRKAEASLDFDVTVTVTQID